MPRFVGVKDGAEMHLDCFFNSIDLITLNLPKLA